MLDEICFAPEGDELCESPPTLNEISNTTDEDARKELDQKRKQILDARRTLSEVSQNNVTDFLLSETRDFRLDLEAPYFLDPEAVTLAPDETGIQEIRIRRIGSSGVQLQGKAARLRRALRAMRFSSTAWTGRAARLSILRMAMREIREQSWLTSRLNPRTSKITGGSENRESVRHREQPVFPITHSSHDFIR